jgi:hypothetical protein
VHALAEYVYPFEINFIIMLDQILNVVIINYLTRINADIYFSIKKKINKPENSIPERQTSPCLHIHEHAQYTSYFN